MLKSRIPLLPAILTCGLLCFCSLKTIYAQANQEILLANEYYTSGEYDKALDLYSKLYKKTANIPYIHSTYFNLLLKKNDYKQAQKYLNTAIKRFPKNMSYKVDQALLIKQQNGPEAANKYLDNLLVEYNGNYQMINDLAKFLQVKGFYHHSTKAYMESRRITRNPNQFALELATVYKLSDKEELMISEYLNYAAINNNTLAYIKRIFEDLINTEKLFELLESALFQRIQEQPQVYAYTDLIVWTYLQQKLYYSAFIQARAYDKRTNGSGSRLIEIGRLALKNKAYLDAEKIFEYTAKSYPSRYGFLSERLALNATEERVKSEVPLDTTLIVELIDKYGGFVNRGGRNPETSKALRNQALLYAFYMNRSDTAITILSDLIQYGIRDRNFISLCKLDLGDLYLLRNEPWESTLLYSQVEKANKEELIGHQAKLKNAKLNYYKGDFELAKSHLDILKQATSREISNDALFLSTIIANNTLLDTSTLVLEEFSKIDFLIYQNNWKEAEQAFITMVKRYKSHSIIDEVYWKLSEINLKMAQFNNAINYLNKILEEYAEDILADDAL